MDLKKQLLDRLAELTDAQGDWEAQHVEADKALLEYIGEQDVIDAFEKIPKWYS